MRRLAVLLAFLASPSLAQYQPCPSVTVGWSKQYSGSPITSVQYSQDQFLLYVIFNNATASAFSNVPLSIMQGFSSTKDPVSFYNSFVLPSYHAILLAQSNNCPLLFETGAFIWSD